VVPRHQAIYIRGILSVALAALVAILSLAVGAGGGREMRERRGDVLVDQLEPSCEGETGDGDAVTLWISSGPW
jgi:hypothetical protein